MVVGLSLVTKAIDQSDFEKCKSDWEFVRRIYPVAASSRCSNPVPKTASRHLRRLKVQLLAVKE